MQHKHRDPLHASSPHPQKCKNMSPNKKRAQKSQDSLLDKKCFNDNPAKPIKKKSNVIAYF